MEEQKEFSMEEWFDSKADPDAATMAGFDKFVSEYFDAKAVAEDLDDQLIQQNKKVMAMQGKLVEYLDLLGKSRHVTNRGSITKVEKKQWRAPEGEERMAIIELLKEQGKYDTVMAFNAAKFSSWYEEEKTNNPAFTLDGVEQTITTYIRKGK